MHEPSSYVRATLPNTETYTSLVQHAGMPSETWWVTVVSTTTLRDSTTGVSQPIYRLTLSTHADAETTVAASIDDVCQRLRAWLTRLDEYVDPQRAPTPPATNSRAVGAAEKGDRVETAPLDEMPDATAPAGAEIRILVACEKGSMAHFSLRSGATSAAVAHATLDELWYFLAGQGEMWRRSEETDQSLTVEVGPGVAVAIPSRTHFQVRSTGVVSLSAITATLPNWPAATDEMDRTGEVYFVRGPWEPTARPDMSEER